MTLPQPTGEERLEQAIRQALGRVIDPEIRRPITELDMIGDVKVVDGHAKVALRLTIAGCPAARSIEQQTTDAAASVPGVRDVTVDVGVMTPEQRQRLTERLRGGKPSASQFSPDSLTRVIAVTSGKGGVGKSTVTANLAVALAAKGLRVGLIDADVFGFSIPALLGIEDAKPTRVGELILPPVAFDVKTISIGMFVESATETAVAWRGPMLHRTVQQFLTDVFFGDLDVLLLDLPPGTGDVAISVGQLLPHAEVLVVTTPQPAAADVAVRSGLVARQTGQRVIGVVENMAGLAQPDGTVLELFGAGGGDETARRLEVPLLARVPLSVALREGGDVGRPIVAEGPEGTDAGASGAADPAGVALQALAERIASMGRSLRGRSLPFSAG
ncbi:P-loop NTPase [Ruicaihuangia caeni]|uniref:Iron-sulfur cluster carrier protein n=1 Tax=Ruicaihuangia caeni TaxID=3042517 RepID=A0AAW6TB39_9MICO|nr:Mrp/NBP35 family ATP-binding protein [Klugiella sp. YN-L-19]MDI2099664.1 Mrp/NBP35 family ATP-binding protein [Klugiella sp. YN-L-19]